MSGQRSGSTLRTAAMVSRKKRAPVLEAAAIFVAALVAERRQEFVHQVAVSGVDLDDAEAGAIGALRREREGVPHLMRSRPRSSARGVA